MREVFLRSPARGLQPYSDAVYRTIAGLDGYHCVRMEDFGARDMASDAFCRARVAECDLFILILGDEYGSCPAGREQSFAEREYEAALDAGLRPDPRSDSESILCQAQ